MRLYEADLSLVIC